MITDARSAVRMLAIVRGLTVLVSSGTRFRPVWGNSLPRAERLRAADQSDRIDPGPPLLAGL